MKEKYTSIIFDLGRVLFHWNPVTSALKAPFLPEKISSITQSPFWQLCDLGYITHSDLISHYSKEYSEEHLKHFLQIAMNDLRPLHEGLKLLECAKKCGYNTFILSNLSREFHDFLFKNHTFLRDFNGAIFSFEVQRLKPDFEIYDLLLRKYSLNPKHCLFFDDLDCNVYAAKKRGIDALQFDPNRLTTLLQALEEP